MRRLPGDRDIRRLDGVKECEWSRGMEGREGIPEQQRELATPERQARVRFAWGLSARCEATVVLVEGQWESGIK